MSDHESIIGLYPQLTAYAAAICDRRCDVDDLVQEAVARTLASSRRPGSPEQLRYWMFRIIRNLHIDKQRRRKVRSEYSAAQKRLFDGNAPLDENRLEIIVLRQAMESLSPKHREVLYLVDVMGMSYRETAEVMEVATGTVMSRLSRARDLILERMEGSNVQSIKNSRARKNDA